ncbi:MAG: DEAD/DEAH box helicase [Acidobacteriia bacterium]|nr:DEAD/DEAH box helicase [Terriglobia bacterium]
MKMTDLTSYNFPKELIIIWEREESDELLPIQSKAILEYNLLNDSSRNLLVVAPTSSGKTFIGELSAVKKALEFKRTLFLVPFRAIAEELYVNFVNKYKAFGLNIVISNRDHREFDSDIINGQYSIAIVVYEKLAGLIIMNPELFAGVGLIIADEVQMMMDEDRGPTIELLLTKLLLSGEKVRVIALSAVLDKLNNFDKWLNAEVLIEQYRPVELREGVYTTDGRVNFLEFNSKNKGTEIFNTWETREQGLVNLVQSFIKKDEQVLIFCSTRQSTIEIAHMLSEKLSGISSPAIESIKKANYLVDSTTREEIQNLLRASVAYHNSDLALEERLLIEEGFRNREIKAIACTSTLSMGVNVPARNVIVYEPIKWVGQSVPISVADYKNMVGRSGRYSAGDPYGCSYLIAESQAKAASYNNTYIQGKLEAFTSSFGEHAIDSQVLEIIAGGLANKPDEISRFIFSTYNGKYKWITDISKEAINQMISESIELCLEYGAIEINDQGNLCSTRSGRLCASGGYSLDHLRRAKDYLESFNNDVDISILYWALETDYNFGSQAYHIRKLRSNEFRSGIASNLIAINYDQCVILRRCLACYAWILSMPTRQIEANFPGVTIGAIRNTSEVCAWLISFLSDLIKDIEPESNRYVVFEELADRLTHGATKESLGLCRIRGSGLSRDDRNHLVNRDIKTIDDVLASNPEEIPLPQAKAIRLIKAAESNIDDNMEKRKRFQRTRLSSLGIDTSILNKLYEKEGRELEYAIDDLLKPPFINLVCQRVTKQNEGEPDHLLYYSNGNVFVIQTTAREKKNISMIKATSIIGQSSRYKPAGYIIFGRPDFEELARRNSENQIAEGRNYKLIPIPVLAEMFVMFHEAYLSSSDVEKILIDCKGYIGLERLTKRTI